MRLDSVPKHAGGSADGPQNASSWCGLNRSYGPYCWGSSATALLPSMSKTSITQTSPNPIQTTQAMSCSASSGKGFTKEDQEALFDAVTASALSKGSRVGLGFGGGGGSTSPPPPAKAEEPQPQHERGKKDGEQGHGKRSKEERKEKKRKHRSRSRSGERDRRHHHSSKRRSRSASRGEYKLACTVVVSSRMLMRWRPTCHVDRRRVAFP